MTTRDNEPLPDDRTENRTDDQLIDQDRDQYQNADGALSSDGREPGQLPDAVGPDSQAPGMRDHDPMLDRDDLTARTDGPLQGSDALTRDDTVASDNDRGLDPGIGSDDRTDGYADQPRGEDGTLTGDATPRTPGTPDGSFGDGQGDSGFGDGRTDRMSQPADPTAEGTDPSYATGTSHGDQTAVDSGALTTDGPTAGGSDNYDTGAPAMTGDVRAAEGAGGTYGGDTDSHDTGTGAFTDGDTRLDDDTRVDDAVAGDEQYTQNTDANYNADAGTANPTYGADATASDAGGTDGTMAATAATGLDTSGPGDLSASPGAPTSASGLSTPGTSAADADDREPLLRADLTSDLQGRWTTIQQGFVDDPRNAVSDADGLVSEVLQRVQDSFTEQQHTLESQWNDGEPSTDDLRMALQRYRAFFRRLLEV